MREIITKAYFEYSWIAAIINPLIALRTRILPEEYRLKQRFKRSVGYSLNLDKPVTLNEKMQWLKLNDRSLLHPICADKYAVRAHIRDRIGEKYLIPLILHTDNPEEIKPEAFPDYPFIIKTNHDSSGGVIVRDKAAVNWEDVRKNFGKRINSKYTLFGKGEWQYDFIKPKIIAEKLLLTEDGGIPFDYKMHCFHGKVEFTVVDLDRQINHSRNLYDRDWKKIPVAWNSKNGREVVKPLVYDQMNKIAEALSKDFLYVRVDLYVVSNEIYFGELTFHPDSGNGKMVPEEWDTILGKLLKLPIKQ